MCVTGVSTIVSSPLTYTSTIVGLPDYPRSFQMAGWILSPLGNVLLTLVLAGHLPKQVVCTNDTHKIDGEL